MSSVDNNPFLDLFRDQKQQSITLREEHYSSRVSRLKKLEHWILSHRKDIHKAIENDFGKSSEEVDITEIYPVVSELRKIKRELKYWVRSKKVSNPLTYWGTASEVYYEPKGTALIISPWNYPFQLSVGPMLSAIAAGNTIILKPSEYTAHTSALLKKMTEDLYESNYCTVIEGDYKTSGQLLALPFDHIFFTGSPRVGKIVMEAAAKNLTSVTLELGGKSPAIVDRTASIKDAAEKIAWGKWLNAGQTCVAPDYVYCHQSHFDDFVKELNHQIGKQYQDLGKYTAVISDQHMSRLTVALSDAKENGARILFGGDQTEGRLSPTAITDVPSNNLLMKEEIFGPVLPIIPFEDLDETINAIVEGQKPLAMYHFTGSEKAMQAIKQRVSAGTMCFNDCVIQFVHPELPIGGINNSGIGKAHGYHGFLAFSNEKALIKQRRGLTMAKTLYPPFNSVKKLTLELLLKYF